MHRRSIHVHGLSHFNSSQMLVCYLSGFSIRFQKLSRAHGQVTYVLLTRSPLDLEKQAFLPLVRLACIRHAASVHPEPGSNSPFDLALRCLWHLSLQLFVCFEIDVLVCIFISCSVFKDHLHLSSAHLYYQILFASSNVFLFFFIFFTVYAYNNEIDISNLFILCLPIGRIWLKLHNQRYARSYTCTNYRKAKTTKWAF